MDPLLNTYLGQYLLQEVVGRGAGAIVYKAFQPSLNRRVAVKVLLRGLDPHSVSRFEREVQAIAQLQHRNILPIYDFGQQGNQRYFVMQYVEGGASLAGVVARGPMQPVAAMRLLCRLLDALNYAHQQGIIHRDIKPSNILLPSPDWPLLADFGIAKLIYANQLTPPGMALGTAAYMAPEAALQRPLDARADLYATGVVLYEMLTGQVPFTAPTPLALLGRHISEPPPPPRSLHPDVPMATEAVVLRALAKDPADRYQSAAEMQAALSTAIKQAERASAQVWLRGQLGQVDTTTYSARSGYTTRKLVSAPLAAASAPRATPRRHRPAPPKPAPAYPSTPGARPPSLALLAGLLLLLVIGALSWGLSDRSAAAPQPAAEVAPTPQSAAEVAPTLLPTALPVPAASPVTVVEEPPNQPATPAPVAPAPASVAGGATSVLLEDTRWTGGYALSRGSNRYGGRTATWIYGTTSDYSTMSATFEVAGQPVGDAMLHIEGMDSEGPAKTPIRIAVNGIEIYQGPNPLPDDDFIYETGTWASATWRFDSSMLRSGWNEVTISNLAEGAFGGPPFFMLDYAEVVFSMSDS